MNGEILKACRNILGFTQQEVADKMGCSKQILSFTELNKGTSKRRQFANENYYRLWLKEYVEENQEKLSDVTRVIILNLLREIGAN